MRVEEPASRSTYAILPVLPSNTRTGMVAWQPHLHKPSPLPTGHRLPPLRPFSFEEKNRPTNPDGGWPGHTLQVEACVVGDWAGRESEGQRGGGGGAPAPTLPPPMPMPQLLSLSSCRVKQAELFSRASKPRTPSGPNALSLRSSSTSWAPAVMSPSPSEIWAQRELVSVSYQVLLLCQGALRLVRTGRGLPILLGSGAWCMSCGQGRLPVEGNI